VGGPNGIAHGKAANFYGVKRSINLVSDSSGRLASSRFNPLTD
jgi:hypothetical protein